MLILLPFLMMVIVNKVNQVPSDEFSETQCSRYCHNVACKHANEKFETEKQMGRIIHSFYKKNIALLKENKLGLTYKEINLLIYVFAFPALSGIMLWGVLRKSRS